jgi:hypothetical protein
MVKDFYSYTPSAVDPVSNEYGVSRNKSTASKMLLSQQYHPLQDHPPILLTHHNLKSLLCSLEIKQIDPQNEKSPHKKEGVSLRN